ncbi:MAG: PH domain-containing protein [Planctomycetota bacterium]|jgi:hypothetical protein
MNKKKGILVEPHMTFKAPWGRSLKLMTGLSVLILIGIPLIGIFTGPKGDFILKLGMVAMPLTILIISAFFTIRGYVLTTDTLLIKRLGWNSRLDLTNLISVEAKPKAMSGSTRTFGNGGMFCFAGTFYNKKLGSYRAFATDNNRTVILRFLNRTVVITPNKPEEFIAKIEKLRDF